MGIDRDEFVEDVNDELVCPICSEVLLNPVETPCQHLFCECELLEWLTENDTCPVCRSRVNPVEIKRPTRIVLRMLQGLATWCPNRGDGCPWKGKLEDRKAHVQGCVFLPRPDLLAALQRLKEKYSHIKRKCKSQKKLIAELAHEHEGCVSVDCKTLTLFCGGTPECSPLETVRRGVVKAAELLHPDRTHSFLEEMVLSFSQEELHALLADHQLLLKTLEDSVALLDSVLILDRLDPPT